MDIKLNDDEVLVLVVEQKGDKNKLPESGLVENDEPISGLLWGYGDYSSMYSYGKMIYILVKVLKNDLTLDDNEQNFVEFSRGDVIYRGDWSRAVSILQPYWLSGLPEGIKIDSTIGNDCPNYTHGDSVYSYTTGELSHSITKGDSAHSLTTGSLSDSVTFGNYSYSVTCGYRANSVVNGIGAQCVTTGDLSVACAIGDYSQAHTKGDYSPNFSFSCNYARSYSSTEGDFSSSIAIGGKSTTCGDYSHSIILGGGDSASTEGRSSIACVLDGGGRAKSGEEGAIVLTWIDESGRIRIKAGYPGENSIKPNTYYMLDREGNFLECED